MNQAQRSYLIKKIQETTKIRVSALEHSKPKAPDIKMWLLHYILSGKFEILSQDSIKETIRRKALKSKEGEDFLGSNSWRFGYADGVRFEISEIFIIPEEFKIERQRFDDEVGRINTEIREISIQAETLITRIQLASDKTLQTMVNEVDDMGNVSLMDTKLKQITGPEGNLLK